MSELLTLMALNPLDHTPETLDKIIAEMRSMRHAYNTGNLKAGTTKPPKDKEVLSLVKELSSDIDL